MPIEKTQRNGPREPLTETAREGVTESGSFLGPLLNALAESLDVREIFARISDEAHRIVSHDFLMQTGDGNERFEYDVVLQGPVVGLTFKF